MKKQHLLKSLLCLVMAMACNVAWADFTQKWTENPVAPWGTSDLISSEYPEEVNNVYTSTHKKGGVRMAETIVVATEDGTATVKFVYSGGSHKLNILGVDLVNDSNAVVASDYHHGTTGGSHINNTYTLEGVVAGNYTLRYFVCNNGKDGDELSKTKGTITVTGLGIPGAAPSKLPVAGKYYRIGYDFGGTAGVKYLQSTNSPVKGLVMSDDKGDGSIYLVEEVSGNLRLKSVSTGKYLKEDNSSRGLYDVGGNVTFTEGADEKVKIQATSFLHANSSGDNYFVDHCGSDGCAAHNFIIEEVKVLQLTVNTSNKGVATATWNGETKTLPATWVIFEGATITEPTLSVTANGTYAFDGFYEGSTSLGTTIEVDTIIEDRTITANFSPAFFAEKYGEKWVNIVRASNASHAAILGAANAGTIPTFNSLDYANEGVLWCLVGNTESFKIYNKVSGEALALTPSTTPADGTTVEMVTAAEAQSWHLISYSDGYAIAPVGNNSWGINSYTGVAGSQLKFYDVGNAGTHWNFTMIDITKPLSLSVEVDKVWESSPRVAELTFTVNGSASQTRIMGNVDAKLMYLPTNATFAVSSMTYRGYTFDGFGNGVDVYENQTLPEGGMEIVASYTANKERTLYYTPDANGKPYRIPAIATAVNGDIFAIADNRPCGSDIGYGEVDIKCRISTDNGATWSEEFFVADGKGGNTNEMTTGYGDAAIVADCDQNKLLAMMVCGRTVCHDGRWDKSKIGNKTANAINRVARVYATYNEQTKEWDWTQPEEVTDHIYSLFLDADSNATVTSMFIGSGKICQSRVVKKGEYYRLYCSMWTRDGGNRVIYSDDFGGTWNVLGTINDRPAPGGDEPKVEELPDGTVVLSSRKYSGRYFNLFTFDDNTYTTGKWGTCASSNDIAGGLSFGGNSTNGEIYRVAAVRKADGTKCDIMLQSVPTGSSRTDVAIFYKEMEYNEDGTNKYTPETFSTGWTKGIHVSTKGSCYSTMIMQANGRIAFLFEEEPGDYCIVYIPYSLQEITGGEFLTEVEYAGIDNVEQDPTSATTTAFVCDLMGRQVSNMIKGNIYIVNGKKIVK